METNIFTRSGESGRKAVAALLVALAVGIGSIAGCGSRPHFEPLRLDASPENYRSKGWTRESDVKLEKTSTGLHCEVQADPEATGDSEAKDAKDAKEAHGEMKEMYGGITLPGEGVKHWRLEMAFPEPESILRVYVAAYDVKGERVCCWQTPWRAKLRREKAAYMFTQGGHPEGFEPVASNGQGPVHRIEVYVRVKPGGHASFDLFSVELAK